MNSQKNFIIEYFTGLLSIFRAFAFVSKNRSVTVYFAVPFLLNIAILVSLVFLSMNYLYPCLKSLIPAVDVWYWNVLRFALGPFILLFTVVIDLIIYSITGTILCAPLLDFLSEKVEKIVNGKVPQHDQSFFRGILDLFRVGMNALALIAFIVTLNVAIIFLNIVPVLGNGLYFVINFFAVSFIFGFQFFDFPLERRKKHFSEKLNYLGDIKWKVAGLGTGFMLLSFIPVIGFLGIVAGTIAGTQLYLENENK